MKTSDSTTLAKFPRAGLGNLLYIWAKALVFSSLNNMSFYHSGFFKIRIGPWLRREQKKRVYLGYFKNDMLNGIMFRLRYKLAGNKIVEPAVNRQDQPGGQNRTYIFNNHCDDPYDGFIQLKPYRQIIIDSFFSALTAKTKNYLSAASEPVMAVHIRRGDFKGVAWGITPLSFFVNTINDVRSYTGKSIPVTVFSDGSSEELAEVLALPGTRLAENNPDIVDLILMSRSKLLVVSTGSTFSYWAAFLGNMPVVLHPDNPHKRMRGDDMFEKIWEGPLIGSAENWDPLFKKNLNDGRFVEKGVDA